jgi:hypothetical protein
VGPRANGRRAKHNPRTIQGQQECVLIFDAIDNTNVIGNVFIKLVIPKLGQLSVQSIHGNVVGIIGDGSEDDIVAE